MTLDAISSIIKSSAALIAVASAGISLVKILSELKQRGARIFEEKMIEIVRDFSLEDDIEKTLGAISIFGLCHHEFNRYHDQLYYMILGLLNKQSNSTSAKHNQLIIPITCRRVLVKSIELLVRSKYKKPNAAIRVLDKNLRSIIGYKLINIDRIDLGHASIGEIDLSNMLMRKADLGFADLTGANLSYSDLYKARGIKVNLSKANLFRCNLTESRLKYAKCQNANFSQAILKTAFLEEGDLRGANFGGASLQSAHFHKANLQGATFEDSNINEAYFIGVKYDDRMLRSLLKAKNRKNAKFDQELQLALATLSTQENLNKNSPRGEDPDLVRKTSYC